MSAGASLAYRVVRLLILAQFPALLITFCIYQGITLSGLGQIYASADGLALSRTNNIIRSSLVKGDDGKIRIEPNFELLSEIETNPRFKYAVFDPDAQTPIAGSSPELVATLAGLIHAKPIHMHFAMTGHDEEDYAGHLSLEKTPFGRLQIATYGQRFRWIDLVYALTTDLSWNALYSSGAFLLTVTITWFAVRGGLAPLSSVAREAEKIDMTSLRQQLPVGGIPAEVIPLVEAVNKALERLDAGAARMRRYTANAAHELRTPIAIMRARLENSEGAISTQDLLRDASHLQTIVEQLLVAARLDEGQIDLDQRVDVVRTVQETVSAYLPLAIECDRMIEIDSARATLETRGSHRAVECVLMSVLDNALRAEPAHGAVQVRIDAEGVVAICDHGEGVESNIREKIFEPFWRKSEATPGTGLGLAIAKELMDKLHGRIWVEETPGGGATFKLQFQ